MTQRGTSDSDFESMIAVRRSELDRRMCETQRKIDRNIRIIGWCVVGAAACFTVDAVYWLGRAAGAW